MVILILFLKINMVPLKTHYKVLEIETDLNWVSQINGILSLNNFFFFDGNDITQLAVEKAAKRKKKTQTDILKKKTALRAESSRAGKSSACFQFVCWKRF